MEIWKDIPTQNGKYQASNLGNIRHSKRKQSLIGNIDKDGYRYVTLITDGVQKSFKVHRLVAYAFHGVSSQQIDHIDNIKTNNKPENLQYCDALFNNQKRSKDKFGTETNVNWHKTKKKYQVRITKEGKRKNIGHFSNKEDAIKAYQSHV